MLILDPYSKTDSYSEIVSMIGTGIQTVNCGGSIRVGRIKLTGLENESNIEMVSKIDMDSYIHERGIL
jgi:hypothetical protein